MTEKPISECPWREHGALACCFFYYKLLLERERVRSRGCGGDKGGETNGIPNQQLQLIRAYNEEILHEEGF